METTLRVVRDLPMACRATAFANLTTHEGATKDHVPEHDGSSLVEGIRVISYLSRDQDHSWTGELTLDLRNGRGWSVGELELSVRRDTVILRYDGRDLANLDRGRFRAWLFLAEPAPMHVDDVRWSTDLSGTYMSVSTGCFRVDPLSLSQLVSKI